LLRTTETNVVGIDIPIGLPNELPDGGRSCDREARNLLKPFRHLSVFNAPPRPVLQARSYEEANDLHRENSNGNVGMSRQAYGILPKIAEVDDLMTPRLQQRFLEVHPELSFMEMNDGEPVQLGKSRAGGALVRMKLLGACGMWDSLEAKALEVSDAGLADVMDAAAAAWSAARFAKGSAVSVPDVVEKDVRGLKMAIWR